MLSETMQQHLSNQINKELSAAYLYSAMGAYCQSIGMAGAAHWFQLQVEEELQHAKRIFVYLGDQEAKITFGAIEAPKADYPSLLGVFEAALEHERSVTASLNDLYDAAIEERDHATRIFLQWFITEQVEEEATVSEIIDQLKLVGNAGEALLLIDRELASRKAEAHE